jgi:hypothetical protein
MVSNIANIMMCEELGCFVGVGGGEVDEYLRL